MCRVLTVSGGEVTFHASRKLPNQGTTLLSFRGPRHLARASVC